jgi:hypothetical protein
VGSKDSLVVGVGEWKGRWEVSGSLLGVVLCGMELRSVELGRDTALVKAVMVAESIQSCADGRSVSTSSSSSSSSR